MNRYFARLVQRAAGVEHKTHAAPPPPPSPAPAGSDARDPFEAVAPLEPAPASAPAAVPHAEHPESTTRNTPQEPQSLSTPALAPPSPQRVKLPVSAETAVNPPIHPQLVPRAELAAPSRGTQPPEKPKPAEVVEHTRVERETVREIVRGASDKPLNPVLMPAPPSRVTRTPDKPPAPVKPTLVQQPAAPAPERFTPQARPALQRETPKMTPDPRPAPAPAPRQEPRLVIGRMQVEVVPASPPAQAPPRVIHRRPAAPRASSTNPSQLHFGLGQM
jgi:hypothetical protein